MSKLRRYYEPGQQCFVTTVTANRRPILVAHSRLLLRAFNKAYEALLFRLLAWVTLPDHFHAIIENEKRETASIMQRVKLSFSLQMRKVTEKPGPYWQHWYWDHVIRSEEDLRRHTNYIHINPVRHGLVSAPDEWILSSHQRYTREGYYSYESN